MAIDDLHLDRPASSTTPPRRPSSSPLRWIAVAAGGLIAGALLTFWWMSRAQPGTAVPAPTTATDVAVGSKRPARQFMSLPSLDASDSLLSELVSALSRHPAVARLLASPGLIRATTLAVVQIGEGRTPATPLVALRPASRAAMIGGMSGRIDPASHARWDSAVAGLVSVSSTEAAQLYVNVKPLFDQAYIEMGHPGGDFDTAIVRAIDMLADAPAVPADTTVLRRTNFLEYQSPDFQQLPPVQKQFILIGPENRSRVLTWMRQFAANLDLKTQ